MTVKEMVRSYHGASKKLAQLRILSELTTYTLDEVRQILTEAGVVVVGTPGRKKGCTSKKEPEPEKYVMKPETRAKIEQAILSAERPLVEQSVVPEVEQSVVPEVEQSVVPEVEQAVVPEVEQAVVPEEEQSVVPEVEQAVVPEEEQAVLPELELDVDAEVDADLAHDILSETEHTSPTYNMADHGIVLNGSFQAVDKATLSVFSDMLLIFDINKRFRTKDVKEASSHLIKAMANAQLDVRSDKQLDAQVAELDELLKVQTHSAESGLDEIEV